MSIGSRKIHLRLEYDGRTLHEIDAADIKPNAEISIGRGEGNDWRLPAQDTGAHRRHAVLRRLRGGGLVLADCEGRQSLFYLGKPVKEHRLQAGDICGIGDSKLIVEEIAQGGRKEGLLLYHQLEQLTGEAKGKIYRIDKENFAIGSAEACDCKINDSLVSKQHAVIEQHPDGTCWIKDNSRNGTTVNGIPLRKEQSQLGRMLKDGDIIAIAYVELKFWDKNVVHVRSHLVLKLCAVVATLAVALGGYFGFQTIMPSAKALRLRAEQCAANEKFDTAEQLLNQANEARGADVDKQQRMELERKLRLWRETLDNWRQVQDGIAAGKENNDFILLCAKLAAGDAECWNWDATEGVAQMKQAQDTNGLLVYTRSAEEALTMSVTENLPDLLEKLDAVTRTCSAEALAFRAKLQTRAEDTLKELRETLETSNALKNLVLEYRKMAQTDEIVEKIQNLSKKCDEHLASRNKEGRPASKMVQRQCDAYLEPLLMLKRSHERLRENYEALAKFDFAAYQPVLPLPEPDACASAATLPARRADMENANANLTKIRVQLENYRKWFDREFPDGKSALLGDLFTEKTTEGVLSFDCLKDKMPPYSEKEARSKYDKVLGVYVFFEYLRALDADFDTTVFEERFKPALFQASDIFRSLESFLVFCRPPANSPLKTQMQTLLETAPQHNQMVGRMELAEAVLKQRDDYLRELYGIFKNDRTSRRGIVAGGMAFRLITNRHTFVEGKLNEEVSDAFRKLRQELAAIAATTTGEVAPEQMLAAERKLLELGIPGDPFIKQPWTDKFTNE